jgi:hypothetical protein
MILYEEVWFFVCDNVFVGVWVHGGKSTGAWLLSSIILFNTRYMRYIASICFFVPPPSYGSLWESIMTVGELYELYGV